MKKNIVLAGNLTFISLADLIQLLGNSGSSGVLRLTNTYAPAPGLIYFVKGNPVDAAYESLTGLDALFSFFGWPDGEFEFTDEAVSNTKVINKSRMEIILDGLRMLDDGQIEKMGAVCAAQPGSGSGHSIPVIKGPFIDYLYVVEEEKFSDGEKIVAQGNYGSWIWVVLEGVIEIVRETPEGPVALVRLGEGSFIGNISFLLGDNTRSASIVAVGDVQLGVMDSQALSTEFAGKSTDFRDLATSFVKRLKQVTDMAAAAYFKEDHLEEFICDKKPVIREGGAVKGLAIITEGEAAVIKSTDKGLVPLAKLYPGDYIGYVPFLDLGHEPHSASIYAAKDIKTRPVDLTRLQQEYDQLSPTFKNLIENMLTCISVTTNLACEFHKKIR